MLYKIYGKAFYYSLGSVGISLQYQISNRHNIVHDDLRLCLHCKQAFQWKIIGIPVKCHCGIPVKCHCGIPVECHWYSSENDTVCFS